MELKQKKSGDVLIVSVSGRLTADGADEFQSVVEPLLTEERRLVFDLEKTEYIDSTGLGALVAALQKISDGGGKMAIAAIQPKPKVVFDITRAYKVFAICDTVEEAVASCRKK